MTAKRYFVTCEVGDCICELISRKLSDDEFEHLTYQDITDRLNELAKENEQLRKDVVRYRRNFREMEDVKCELAEENEQLKKQIEKLKVDLKMAKINGAIDRMAQRPMRW